MANEKRLIVAHDLWSDIMMLPHNGDMISSEEVEQAIMDAPTVDAVEVVHCKDCIWFDSEDELPDVFRSEQYCYCTEANTYVPINHFCSFGERRTDAESN